MSLGMFELIFLFIHVVIYSLDLLLFLFFHFTPSYEQHMAVISLSG